MVQGNPARYLLLALRHVTVGLESFHDAASG
jgi:hypothetical protein